MSFRSSDKSDIDRRHPKLVRGLVAVALIGTLGLVGCKAKPSSEPSGFLGQPEVMTENELYPFQKIWIDSNWNNERSHTIVIAPVNTAYVKKANWWKEANLKGGEEQRTKDLHNLALYTQEAFQKAFRNDPNGRYHVITSPRSDSVILELALTEVVPNKAALGALGLAATVLAAPMGVAIAAKESGKGATAMEARVVDANGGAVVAMFADREAGKFAPINLRRATWYGESHKIIDEWAAQCVKIVNARPGEKVKDTKTFTIRPW